eukprot:7337360-Prymnesium_polylepis.2
MGWHCSDTAHLHFDGCRVPCKREQRGPSNRDGRNMRDDRGREAGIERETRASRERETRVACRADDSRAGSCERWARSVTAGHGRAASTIGLNGFSVGCARQALT